MSRVVFNCHLFMKFINNSLRLVVIQFDALLLSYLHFLVRFINHFGIIIYSGLLNFELIKGEKLVFFIYLPH
jgi:hypothetical protein